MTSLILLIAVLLLIALPFEIWTLYLDDEKRYKLLRWLYIKLPSRLSRLILPLYWKYAYSESQAMFWGRCFPNERHNMVYTGTGIHCKDCHSYVPNYMLVGGLMTFPNAEGYIDVLL